MKQKYIAKLFLFISVLTPLLGQNVPKDFEIIRREIAEKKKHWKRKIHSLESCILQENLKSLLQTGDLIPSPNGSGGAYFLYSKEGKPQYVIKPVDEDNMCLNNRKYSASFHQKTYRVRDDIPLYRSAQAEVLAFAIADLLGLGSLIPHTFLAVLSHEAFFDITNSFQGKEVDPPCREKFCSVQVFVEQAQKLFDFAKECLQDNLSNTDMLSLIDQENFENLCLLIWLFYDTDAHAGNFFVRKNKKGIYDLFKVDNGLTFPDKNAHLLNCLYFLPHAKLPLSPKLRQTIATLPIEKILDQFHLYEMGDALDAFLERTKLLQQLAEKPSLSIRAINNRLQALSSSEESP